MKNFYTIIIVFISIIHSKAQDNIPIKVETTQGILVKITPPLSTFKPDPSWQNEVVRDENGVIGEDKNNIEHRFRHPNAVPAVKTKDPVIQDFFPESKARIMNIIQNFQGHGNTGVSPADPSICVGSNHVIQMINGSSGARMTIYNKIGGVVVAAQYMDAITGVPGLGDPVAIYDQFADRYVLTEFSSSGNKLMIMVSQTNDPTGSWYVYQFTATEFPDYPKYGVWSNAYICTSNESSNKVYAFDRPTMLTGAVTTTMITFSIPGSPAVGFQAAAPVNISGTTLPPLGTNPIIMRMVDDGWGGGLTDELEMWDMNLDFITPLLSTLTQLPSIATVPFTTDLCGYVTLNCIRQPNSQRLDPIREIIMNRVWYRNFITHQSIVLCHTVDASGLDQAGIRWYELRRAGLGPWSIYQQSTYAPDTNSRWMGTICINSEGSIGLAYNVSSKNVFPSFRFTGRKATDFLNTMSEPEQTIIAGAANHTNNRWGDYNDMQIDPTNDATFWTTGMYMPNPAPWSTRIAAFNILYAPLPVSLISFDGNKINETKNELKWKVENEKNVDAYKIERSNTLITSFETISELSAKNIEGDVSYQFNDEIINRFEDYIYRLKISDIDGKYRYSNTVLIQGKKQNDIEMYPNPIEQNTMYIRISEKLSQKKLEFSIIDMNGKYAINFIKNISDNSQIQSIDVSELKSGIYILKCVSNDGNNLLNKTFTIK